MVLAFLIVLLLLNKFNQISGKDIEPAGLFSVQVYPWNTGCSADNHLAGRELSGTLSFSTETSAGHQGPVRPEKGQWSAQEDPGGLSVLPGRTPDHRCPGGLQTAVPTCGMRNLGFDKNNLVHIELRGNLNQEYEMLREEFMRDPGVFSTTASMQPPYRVGSNSSGIDWEGKDPEQDVLVSFTGVHYDFVETMGITLQAGRDFSEEYPADMYQDTVANFILNKTLADIIGKDEMVGMELQFMGIRGQIVGVMEDYHFKPLGDEIEPMALAPLPAESLQHMVVRLAPDNPQDALKFIEEKWAELLPQYPLEYTFVDRCH